MHHFYQIFYKLKLFIQFWVIAKRSAKLYKVEIYPPREFGSLIGRTTNTLQRWDRQGILKAHRTSTGRRYYTHDQYLEIIGQKSSNKRLVVYCRVSSAGQKNDLISQRNAVESFCIAQGKAIDLKLEDIGSGLRKYKKKIVEMTKENANS
jgi:predicted site-specific integrase-resolvase